MQNLIQLDVSIPKLDNEGYKFYQKAMNHRLEKAVDWLDFVSKKTALRGCSYIVYSTSSEFSSKLELIESIIGNNNFYVFMTKDKNIIKLNVFLKRETKKSKVDDFENTFKKFRVLSNDAIGYMEQDFKRLKHLFNRPQDVDVNECII